jgi:hypothetical protein
MVHKGSGRRRSVGVRCRGLGDIDEHRGKWVALDAQDKVVAVRDTGEELREEFGDQHLGVIFFHVPTSDLIAR